MDEAGLSTGSHPGDAGHPITAEGNLTLGDPNSPVVTGAVGAGGPAGTADGATHILGAYGYLTIDAAGHYTYTLTTNELDPTIPAVQGPNIEPGKDVFTYTVKDAYGNTNTSTITISIKDDVPTANADAATTDENKAVTFDVKANDVPGADGVNWTNPANVTYTSPAHGSVVYNNNGTFTYTPNTNYYGVDSFTYTITDGDGDKSTATVSLTVNFVDTPPQIVVTPANPDVNGYNIVNEAGIVAHNTQPGGTSAGNGSAVAQGTFKLTDTDGASDIKTITITGVGGPQTLTVALNGGGTTVQGQYGTLVIAANPAIVGNTVTYSYTYTLTTNELDSTHTQGTNIQPGQDSFALMVTDGSGKTSSTTLGIDIRDDIPVFGTPDHGVIADQPGMKLIGDLNALFGADGPAASGALSLAGNTAPSNLLYDGTHKILYSISGTTLTGYADMDNSGTQNAGDVTVFTLSLDPVTDQYTFTLNSALTQSIQIGGSGTGYGTGPAQQDPLTVNNGATQIAIVSTSSGHQVNGSSGGWGVDNANFDKNEVLRFDFTDGAVNSPTPVANFHAASSVFADFTFSKNGSVTYNVHYTDGSSTGNVTVNETGSLHLGVAGKVISYIDFTANDGLGKLDLTHVDQVYSVSQDLLFNVTATDGDGDSAAGQIGIHVAGNNVLQGTTGDDVLSAGLNTTLTGSNGADHFLFTSASATGTHITDFSGSTGVNHQNDIIELLSAAFGSVSWNSDGSLNETIYQGADAATKTLGASQHFAYNSTTGQLYYDSNGGDTSGATRILLAILDNHAALSATDVHKV